MDKYNDYTTTDFLNDMDFVNHVKRPNEEESLAWKNWVQTNPSSLNNYQDAVFYLQGIVSADRILPTAQFTDQLYADITQEIENLERQRSIKLRIWWGMRVAAAILLLGIAGYYTYQTTLNPRIQNTIAEVISHGGNRAYLTTESGEIITLSTEQTGIIIGEELRYADGSLVEGLATTTKAIDKLTITVPKGGIYQVQLADGSKVWLNSFSKLTYPSSFSGDQRLVELEGEAYFEVTKDSKRPFRVQSKEQLIQVLGTSFNVAAYDDAIAKTTLVEGSVQVTTNAKPSAPLLLSPGEQSILASDGILIHRKANIQKELAWKSGIFFFDQTSLSEVINEIARWYDVEVHYKESDAPQSTYTGIVDRNVSLPTLLEFLEDANPRFSFELKSRILNVTPKRSKSN